MKIERGSFQSVDFRAMRAYQDMLENFCRKVVNDKELDGASATLIVDEILYGIHTLNDINDWRESMIAYIEQARNHE